MTRLLVVLALAGGVAGCTSTGAAWISASRFEYRDYDGKSIALMPVMFEGQIENEKFPRDKFRAALSSQLDVLRLSKIVDVEADDAGKISFPYTPKKLAAFGRPKGFDGVVGATLIRMEEWPSRRQWSFSGFITFVDTAYPERRWTVAKTWDMTGKPSSSTVKFQLANALLQDLIEVRRVLDRGAINTLLLRQTIVENGGAALSLDVVDKTVDSRNEVRQPITDPNKVSDPGSRQVLVDVFAIDDDGIESLSIRNDQVPDFSYVSWGQVPEEKKGGFFPWQKAPVEQPVNVEQNAYLALDSGKLPDYLGDRVAVPLVEGLNTIVATATGPGGRKVGRTVRVIGEISDAMPVNMIVIAPMHFQSEQEKSLVLLPEAETRLAALESLQGGEESGGNFIFRDQNAQRDRVLRDIGEELNRRGARSRRVLAFVGRAELVHGRPYLVLYDAAPDNHELGRISVREFVGLTETGVARAVLDLCTDAKQLDYLKSEIDAYVDPERRPNPEMAIDVNVRPDCSQAIGQAFLDTDREAHKK